MDFKHDTAHILC